MNRVQQLFEFMQHKVVGRSREAQCNQIARSGLFDENWYREKNTVTLPGVMAAIDHYVRIGDRHNRAPHPLFDAQWYKQNNPRSGPGTLLNHYISMGAGRNTTPHPLFDPTWYRASAKKENIDVPIGYDAFLHFLQAGGSAGISPHALFDSKWYLNQVPGLASAKVNPLTHFIECGVAEGRWPNPSFDMTWYTNTYDDVARSGLNPLVHFIFQGARLGLHPHPDIDLDRYISSYDDVPKDRLDAFIHLVTVGKDRSTIDVQNDAPKVFNSWMSSSLDKDAAPRPVAAWYIPPLLLGSGGISNMFHKANAMVRAGFECHMYIQPGEGINQDNVTEWVTQTYGSFDLTYFCGFELRRKYDILISTMFYSCFLARDSGQACPKVYFNQDYEALFHEMGDGFIAGENSYIYGHIPITSGRWLSHVLAVDYGIPAYFVDIGADTSTYRPMPNSTREDAICFVYQPEKHRRCPDLGIRALEIVKRLRPNCTIYLFGSKGEVEVNFEHVNLGMLPGPKDINELYNRCRAGLCISSTNPSRVPYEMMAAGLPVVDIYRYNNLFDSVEEGTALAHQTSESLAAALVRYLDDRPNWDLVSSAAARMVEGRTVNREHVQFVTAVSRILLGRLPSFREIPVAYTREPVISASEAARDRVGYFCRYQQSLAYRSLPSSRDRPVGESDPSLIDLLSELSPPTSRKLAPGQKMNDASLGSINSSPSVDWEVLLDSGYRELAATDLS